MDFKDISVSMLELLDELIHDTHYTSVKRAFEEVLGEEIVYDANENYHVIL